MSTAHTPTLFGSIALNHVGITVPDIFAAIDWYGEVFGFTHIMGPRLLEAASQATREVPSILGPKFRKAYQAHVLTGNGVGLELFQFIDPAVEPPDAEMVYWRPGPWHLCFTHRDVAAMVDRIVRAGGTRRTEAMNFVPGRPWQLAYCADPWKNTIEVMSHSYAEVFANWPQPGMTVPPAMVERPSPATAGP